LWRRSGSGSWRSSSCSCRRASGRWQTNLCAERERVELVEGVDESGVELRAAQTPDLGDCFLDGPGVLVGPLVGERVEDVGDGDQSTGEGDLVAFESVWVAAAVLPFVVGEGDLASEPEHVGVAFGEDGRDRFGHSPPDELISAALKRTR
jgi:hypothetical protein